MDGHGKRMARHQPDPDPDRRRSAVDILDALRLLLLDEGYDVTAARSPAEALERLEASDFDLAILDLNYTRDTTSGQEGFDLMERIRVARSDAARARHDGLEQRGGRGRGDAARRARLHREAVGRRAAARGGADADRAAARAQRRASGCRRRTRGCSAARPRRSSATPRRSSRSGRPSSGSPRRTRAVLITGEHGTGKEVVATWLHALSDRRSKALVTMNAGGLAEGIAESELFGHVKGAFTDARVDRIGCFEMADEGTLFLDEIANMPMRLQAKLLRVLQTGELPARRLVAAPLRQRARAVGDQRRPPTRRSPPAASAKTCSIVSTPSSFTCRRCAIGATDIDALARALPGALRGALPEAARRVRRRRRRRRCRRTAGPATCASWRTASSARC